MTVPKRFGVLRFFGTFLKVIAWIFLILSIFGAIAMAVAGSSTDLVSTFFPQLGAQAELISQAGLIGGILAGIVVLLGGLIYFLFLYVAGELLHMQLAVEENTRLTAALLLRMHQEGQGESSAPYGAGGGFSHEPYDN